MGKKNNLIKQDILNMLERNGYTIFNSYYNRNELLGLFIVACNRLSYLTNNNVQKTFKSLRNAWQDVHANRRFMPKKLRGYEVRISTIEEREQREHEAPATSSRTNGESLGRLGNPPQNPPHQEKNEGK